MTKKTPVDPPAQEKDTPGKRLSSGSKGNMKAVISTAAKNSRLDTLLRKF